MELADINRMSKRELERLDLRIRARIAEIKETEQKMLVGVFGTFKCGEFFPHDADGIMACAKEAYLRNLKEFGQCMPSITIEPKLYDSYEYDERAKEVRSHINAEAEKEKGR